MHELDRRTFLKLIGPGTAALGLGGMGLSGNLWAAQSGGLQAKKTADSYWDEWEFYYPGKYDEEDAKILMEFMAACESVEKKGEVNISDLVSGKLTGNVGIGRAEKVTLANIESIAKANVPNNPLFMDREYVKKTKYKDLFAFPMLSSLEVMPAMVKDKGFADHIMVSSHNDTNSYYKPFYEGDTLYQVVDYQRCWDITPAEGSYYRTFVMSGRARVFNQKGELVADGANVLKESFRRHRDKSKRNPDGVMSWESPNWWSRPKYYYTDKDWDKIIAMWKNEKVRGAETLYWDEVEVGEMLTPKAVGPLIQGGGGGMTMSAPQAAIDIRKNVLDPKIFPTMKKNEFGIWILPGSSDNEAGGRGPGGGMPHEGGPEGGQGAPPMPQNRGWVPSDLGPTPVTEEIALRDGRSVFQNSVAAKLAAGMICDWIGDDGWLQRVGWDIMDIPPGSDASIDYQSNPTRIPNIPREYYPDLFDKYPYMDKVPFMRGCRAAWHVLENDLLICNAYVTSKYRKGGEYFVDLTWWDTTFDGYMVQEGFATVKLPKKS
jgi:acyl dehydratase